jgi:hypothetical protein
LPVAPADADSEELDAEPEVEEVGMGELETLLRCEVIAELMESDAVAVAVVAAMPSSVEVEEDSSLEPLEESSESLLEKLSEVDEALLGEPDVLVADVVAVLPVAAVSGTALPAEQVMSGTPLMMPWFGSPRQQVKSLASLLLPVPPIREPSQQ